MDIEDIVSQLKERGTVIKEPHRLRRKKPKAVTGKEPYRGSAREKASHREAERRFKRTVSGTYKELVGCWRRKAKTRAARKLWTPEWKLSLEDWQKLWSKAGHITLPGGIRVLAFKLRGRAETCCRMYRIDELKDWEMNNVVILYNGSVLVNGRELVVR